MSDEFHIEEAWAPYKDLVPVENIATIMQTVSPYLGQPIQAVVPSIVSTADGPKIDKLFFATADLWSQVSSDGSDISIVRRRAYWMGWNIRATGVQVRIDHIQAAYSIVEYVGKDAETWSNQLRSLFPADVVVG